MFMKLKRKGVLSGFAVALFALMLVLPVAALGNGTTPTPVYPPVTSPLKGDITLTEGSLGTAPNVRVSVGGGAPTEVAAVGGYYEVIPLGTSADVGQPLQFEVKMNGIGWVPADPTCVDCVEDPPVFANYDLQTVNLTAPGAQGDPPSVSTTRAYGVTCSSINLEGNLDDLGTSEVVTVSFEWGLTTAYGNTANAGQKSTTGLFYVAISGLAEETTYHFRAKASGLSGTVYGIDRSFRTLECDSGGGGGTTYIYYDLDVAIDPPGGGSVTLNPTGGNYKSGVIVTLTANPAEGYEFGSWSGDLSGSDNPKMITMNSNKDVTANFELVAEPTATPTGTPTTTPTGTPTTTPTGTPTTTPTGTPTSEPSDGGCGDNLWLIIVLIVAVGAIGGAAYYFLTHKK